MMIFKFPTSFGGDGIGNRNNHGGQALEAAVRTALDYAPDLDASLINISRYGSLIFMDGFVAHRWQIGRAGAIAEDVAGPGVVRNRILKR